MYFFVLVLEAMSKVIIKEVINAKGVTVSTPLDPFALIFRKQMRDIGGSSARFTASGKRALIANVRLQLN